MKKDEIMKTLEKVDRTSYHADGLFLVRRQDAADELFGLIPEEHMADAFKDGEELTIVSLSPFADEEDVDSAKQVCCCYRGQ